MQNKILPQYSLGAKKITTDLSVDETFVLADLSALNIIFRNLFDNAIKYSTDSPTQIVLKGQKADSFYFLDFEHKNSNFAGDKAHLGKLFYRGPNSQGAGVGLYLIQTLMQKMKGSADFSHADKKFSTHLTFKVEKNEASDG